MGLSINLENSQYKSRMATRRKLSEAVKKIVAYSQQWTCKQCERLLPPTYQVDHIIPHCILADDSPQNLQALCPNCHSTKTQGEYMRIIRYKKKRALKQKHLCWFYRVGSLLAILYTHTYYNYNLKF